MLFINLHKIATKYAHPVLSDIFLVLPTAAKVGIIRCVTIHVTCFVITTLLLLFTSPNKKFYF